MNDSTKTASSNYPSYTIYNTYSVLHIQYIKHSQLRGTDSVAFTGSLLVDVLYNTRVGVWMLKCTCHCLVLQDSVAKMSASVTFVILNQSLTGMAISSCYVAWVINASRNLSLSVCLAGWLSEGPLRTLTPSGCCYCLSPEFLPVPHLFGVELLACTSRFFLYPVPNRDHPS